MKIIAIIQARMSSTRLPGKVLRNLNDNSVIFNIYHRVSMAHKINKVIVATSTEENDDVLYEYCHENNMNIFRGSLNNVLERYYECATSEKADIIIRLTGDNPLIDAQFIDKAIEIFSEKQLDYLSYCKQLPLGMGIEVFSYDSLKRTYNEAHNQECQEHVTLYMYKNPNSFSCLKYDDDTLHDNSNLRFTVDTEKDYDFACSIYKEFGETDFSYFDILELLKKKPQLVEINNSVVQKKVTYDGE